MEKRYVDARATSVVPRTSALSIKRVYAQNASEALQHTTCDARQSSHLGADAVSSYIPKLLKVNRGLTGHLFRCKACAAASAFAHDNPGLSVTASINLIMTERHDISSAIQDSGEE